MSPTQKGSPRRPSDSCSKRCTLGADQKVVLLARMRQALPHASPRPVPCPVPIAVSAVGFPRYPDGFRLVGGRIVTMRDGMVWRAETFWAPLFEPAPWRSPRVTIEPTE